MPYFTLSPHLPAPAAQGLEGFPASTVAALWFLALSLIAVLTSLASSVIAARGWKRLSATWRLMGQAHAALSAVLLVALLARLLER